jgi:hypothetical protein
MYQAIETKYLAPTNHRGARIAAVTGGDRRVVIPYDHALNVEQNHAAAAFWAATSMGWGGSWSGGSTRDGFCFVLTSTAGDFQVV